MQKPRLSVFPRHESSDDVSESDRRTNSAKGSRNASPERVQNELDRVAGTLEPKSVTVRLATIVPLLLDAVEQNRSWLSDFSDDTVRLDADLFEVLLAYQELREEAAA